MKAARLTLIIVAFATAAVAQDSRPCATCHTKIYETYQKSAMARSFYAMTGPARTGDYYHAASETHFQMIQRDGHYYQRRYQTGFEGKETNVEEKSIDFVMGSGNHVRTYLHRTQSGALQELPLAWYAEKGGYWAMNPGYDNASQPNSRRKIDYECMGCHNAWPKIPAGHEQLRAEPVYSGALPEGIDCQRCHGPGESHVQMARKPGSSVAAIRSAVVNPARLAPDRRMEVCMQCHLETTSFPFPHSISRFDRGPFSYQAGESLSTVTSYFDHAPARPDEDRFQIVNSVYRLRMSQCFLKSGGRLQCTTCHDPHGASEKPYNEVCAQCHNSAFQVTVMAGKHTGGADCVGCHMPKRRTDDVVHAVMTEHFIRRTQPSRDLLAEIPEPNGAAVVYKGEALPYYPLKPDELTVALAQVSRDVNAGRGIVQLAEAIRKHRPAQAEYSVELADALLRNGRPKDAIPRYREALRLKPDSLAGLIGLGQALDASGDTSEAVMTFGKATKAAPDDAFAWQMLGQSSLKLRRYEQARTALEKSLEMDPDVPEAHYALGSLWAERKDAAQAETSFREAIRLQPDYSQAHLNLAILLSQASRFDEAGFHFERALKYRPDYRLGHLNYGLMLRRAGRLVEAEQHLEAAAGSSDKDVRR